MKLIFLVFLLTISALFAQQAPFTFQSDMVAYLSDSVLDGIFHHCLGFDHFFGLAIVGGVLDQERTFRGGFGSLKENPQGMFISPELTCSYQSEWWCSCPIFSGTLRYAGFFSQDYQNLRMLDTPSMLKSALSSSSLCEVK